MRAMTFAVGLLLPGAALAQTCTAPGPAAAVGYNQMTYGGGLKLGQNIFPVTGDNASSGVSQNTDGSVSIRGGDANHYNNQLNTGAAQFGGGLYAQATLSFENTPAGWSSSVDGWPAFWMTSTTNEQSNVEVDFFEWMTGGSNNSFGSGLIDWSKGGLNSGAYDPSTVSLKSDFDPSQSHTYGYLWVPATGSQNGYTQLYVDGQKAGPEHTWSQGGGMLSSLDGNQLQIMFGTGSANPMTVYDLQVWQGNGANNAGSPQQNGTSCGPIATTALNGKGPIGAPSGPATNPAPFADNNCPGLTYLSNGTQGWNYGGTSDGLSAGNGEFASNQSSSPSAAVSANGKGMSIGTVQSGGGLQGAMLNTHKVFAQKYGYFEMTAELTAGALQPGMTTAFWLMPESGGWPPEIDIQETDGNTGDTDVHAAPGQSSGASHQYNMTPGKHVWAVDWNEKTITNYIDGQIPTLDNGKPAVIPTPSNFHQPMYMVLDAMSRQGAQGKMNVEQIRVFKDMQSALACVPDVPAPPKPTLASTSPSSTPSVTLPTAVPLPSDLQSQITQSDQTFNQAMQQPPASKLTGPAAEKVAHSPIMSQINAANEDVRTATDALAANSLNKRKGDKDDADDKNDKDEPNDRD